MAGDNLGKAWLGAAAGFLAGAASHVTGVVTGVVGLETLGKIVEVSTFLGGAGVGIWSALRKRSEESRAKAAERDEAREALKETLRDLSERLDVHETSLLNKAGQVEVDGISQRVDALRRDVDDLRRAGSGDAPPRRRRG